MKSWWYRFRELVRDLKDFRKEIKEEVKECVFNQLGICECKWVCRLEMDKLEKKEKARKSWD